MKLSRRDALKTTAVGAAAVALGCSGRAEDGDRPGVRYGMVIDLRKCFGCHACSIACKAEQEVPLAFFKSWVIQTETGQFPHTARRFVPVLCNHCDEPPCVEGCPTGATWQRQDGIVVQDQDSCIGCKYCVVGCPYGVKYADPVTRTAQKCDFCVHLVDQGLLPACVETCNAKARVFGDLNDPESEVSRLIRKHRAQPLLPHMGTKPRVFYIALDPATYRRPQEGNVGTLQPHSTGRREDEH